MPSPTPNVPLSPLPEPKVFTCSQCGECCSKVMVPIERELVAHLEEQPWVQQRFKALLGPNFGFEPYDTNHAIIPHRDDGYCVFLGEQNQCLIEAVEGIAYKPTECLRFPFGSVMQANNKDSSVDSKPIAFRADGSVGCRTLAEGLFNGVLRWQPRDPEWYARQKAEPLPRHVPVTRFKRIGWDAYNQWVEHLHRVVTDNESISSWATLREAKRSLDEVSRHPIIASPGKISGTLANTAHQSNPTETPPRQWVDQALCTLLLRKPYGWINAWAIWRQGSYMDMKVFGPQPVDLTGHNQIDWPNALDTVVARFLVVLLSRQLMLAYGHRLDNMLAMAIGTRALVHWYGRTLALIQGKSEVAPDDALGALRLVERYYTGHQPMFPEFFRWRPGWGTWARWVLR